MTRPAKLLTVVLPYTAAVLAILAPAPARAAVTVASASAPCAAADALPQTAQELTVAGASIVCLLNAERAARGTAPLRTERRLAVAAVRHSSDMVARGFFEHRSPAGTTPAARIMRTGWGRGRDWIVGEDLAWGTGRLGTPRATVAAWMNSAPHRRNVLERRFRQVGVGIAPGAPRPVSSVAATYTANFGG